MRVAAAARVFAVAAAALAAGCRPDFGAPTSLVTAPRLLGTRAEPAEAAPGQTVTVSALAAAPDGPLSPALAWSLCSTPRPISENGAVAASCLAPDGTQPLASSAAPLPVMLPSDGCRLFGPDLPPQLPGQPPLQPRAPDVTGGYYQPLRVDFAGATIAEVRLRCSLSGASADQAADFAARYHANRNPTLTALTATVAGQPVALDQLPAGRVVTLHTGWTADSPETYPVLDPVTTTLVDHREALTVSWFASSGSFADERSGRGEDDPALDVSDAWTAPSTPGPVHLWLVLRDARGGADFATVELTVVP
jgi:hypothetical protein